MSFLDHRPAVVAWAGAAVLAFAGAAATALPAYASNASGNGLAHSNGNANGQGNANANANANGNANGHGQGNGNGHGNGNNGTIKIQDGSENSANANDPHLACPIHVVYQGFDNAADTYLVDIHTVPPSTPHDAPIDLLTDSGTFTQSGDFPYRIYDTQLTGAKASNKGEYHVDVHVTVSSSNGANAKDKVVWLTPCTTSTPTQTPTQAPTSNATSNATNGPPITEPTVPTSGSVSEPVVEPTAASTPQSVAVLGEHFTRPPAVKVLGQHFTSSATLPFTGPSIPLVPVTLFAFGLAFSGLAMLAAVRRRSDLA